jgi:hypothetical protein
MHATNVLVRHGDAILIDFEKLEQDYPLTYDPASLEGGLLVEGFLGDLEKGRFEQKDLVQRIEPLYELSALRVDGTTFCPRGDLTEWYFDAVNQIRTLSWGGGKRAWPIRIDACPLSYPQRVQPSSEPRGRSAKRFASNCICLWLKNSACNRRTKGGCSR